MPVNWQDGVTDVNAANLETMEADTAAVQAALTAHAAAADPHTVYQRETEKAAANGYAPLDGSAKVPLVNLPPVSGVDYIGDWGGAIPYKKGDVVRYGGNDYMAVNDSTGVTPPAAASIPLGGVGIGTSLPAAPYDGQEFVLTDSLTAPTYAWRLRYTAGISDAYKWVFIGGSSLVARDTGSVNVTNNAYADFSTVLQVTVPRAGNYEIDASIGKLSVINGLAGHWSVFSSPGGGEVEVNSIFGVATGNWMSGGAVVGLKLDGLSVGSIIKQRGYCGSGTLTVQQRSIAVRPVRVA